MMARGRGATAAAWIGSRVVAFLALMVVTAACASPAPSSAVVTLDSPGASGVPGGSPAPSGDNLAAQLVAYSQCMRAHGVANFPDPEVVDGQVRAPRLTGTGIDTSSATFHAAGAACHSILPAPPGAEQPMSQADQAKWLAFAQCVRGHGVSGFPDPDFSNGGPKPYFDFAGTGIDARSATVAAAQQDCQSLVPVLNGGASAAASGAPSASPEESAQP
jgi:hypothetical protein